MLTTRTAAVLCLAIALAIGAGAAQERLDESSGWIQLFNGKDLTGWKTHPDQPGGWTVEDRALVGRTDKTAHLFSTGEYENFHLRAEIRINKNGNSGLYFRSSFGVSRLGRYPHAYEAQILNSSQRANASLTGSLNLFADVHKSPVGDDEWFDLDILAKGNHIVIRVNGASTADIVEKTNAYQKGHFVLQALDEGTPTHVRFRKIEVKRFPGTTDNRITGGNDAVGKSLGLTPETKSLPPWVTPGAGARQSLGDVTRSRLSTTVQIGAPKRGHGTGWVLSARHRLLATNAHVADMSYPEGKLWAILNGTAHAYEVTGTWYHPGVRRIVGKGRDTIRSMDPRDGPTHSWRPDVAVLQLSMGGPDLPAELPMARPEDLGDLFAQPIAILGFPGHDTTWPKSGAKAQATFHDGVVSRLVDFRMNPNAPEKELQFLQYTLSGLHGFSGSPVYLPNGRVIGIHNSIRQGRGAFGQANIISHGVRVDSLWELLAHHGLEKLVPIPVAKAELDINRWLVRDERDEKLRQAMKLVDEADELFNKEDFIAAVDKCNAAIKIAPNYPPAFEVRSMGFTSFRFNNAASLSRENAVRLCEDAKGDAETYAKLVGGSDPRAITLYCNTLVNLDVYTADRRHARNALNVINKLLTSDNLSNDVRAFGHSIRACAFAGLEQDDDAVKDHNEAIRLFPNEPAFWETRAAYWRSVGRTDREAADKAKAKELRGKR